jgi:type II secretory pathway component PulC
VIGACKPAPRTAEAPSDVDETSQPATAAAPRPPRPERTIYRAELLRARGRSPAYLLRQLEPVAARDGHRFVGWRINRLFPDDPALCAEGCDLEVGDIIVSVNRRALETPDDYAQLWTEAPTLQTLEVEAIRDGERRTKTYTILDAGR